MKIFLIGILLFTLVIDVHAQDLNQVVISPDSGKEILIGKCTRDGLVGDPFAAWFNEGYQSYTPDQNAIKELRKRKKDLQITVVMGTWCGDTRTNLPRFYKILDELKFSENDVELIAVGRDKSAEGIDIAGLGVTLLPTFIFSKDGVEIGRIVENPTLSIEKDMLLILMQAD